VCTHLCTTAVDVVDLDNNLTVFNRESNSLLNTVESIHQSCRPWWLEHDGGLYHDNVS
jgi:hypothetical protein